MTERLTDEPLPGLSERDFLQSMTPDWLVDHIVELGERVTHIETKISLASVVLQEAYGLTVEDVLIQRETRGEKSGEQK